MEVIIGDSQKYLLRNLVEAIRLLDYIQKEQKMKNSIMQISILFFAGVLLLVGCDQVAKFLQQDITGTLEYNENSMSIEMGK